MKQHNSTYRFTSLLLVVLIFISSSGISLSMHYCGTELYDFALFGEAKTCKKEGKPKGYNLILEKSGCCSFGHFNIDTSDNYSPSKMDKEVNYSSHFALYSIQNFTFVESKILFSETRICSPPPITKSSDIYKLIETYLI